jgi:hypothetical protein
MEIETYALYSLRAPLLIEANMPHSSQPQELQVDTSSCLDCIFILLAMPAVDFELFLCCNFGLLRVDNMDCPVRTSVRLPQKWSHWECVYCYNPYL